MNEKEKKKQSAIPPYISKPLSPEEEPDYKELYFNLLDEFERVRAFIKIVMDKSVSELNKRFKPTYIDKKDI